MAGCMNFHTETGLLNDLSSLEKFECMYLFEMSVWNRKLSFAIIKTSLNEIALKKSIGYKISYQCQYVTNKFKVVAKAERTTLKIILPKWINITKGYKKYI